MPHNLVAVSRLIFHSERGCHLQRLASYCMIHKLLELDHSLDGLADITVRNAFDWSLFVEQGVSIDCSCDLATS